MYAACMAPRTPSTHNVSEGCGDYPNDPRGIAVSGGDAYVQKVHPHAEERQYENDESGLTAPDSIAYPG